MTFRERKEERKQFYNKYVHGHKLRTCCACAGSGRYDNFGSPKCSSCNGTGRERYKPIVDAIK